MGDEEGRRAEDLHITCDLSVVSSVAPLCLE